MAIDLLDTYVPTAITGCRSGGAVTPSDTVDLPHHTKAIRCTGGGTVTFIPGGNAVQASAGAEQTVVVTVAANETFDMFQMRRILATGTTATGIIGGWN